MAIWKKSTTAALAVSAVMGFAGAANAHLVSFGWLDNGDGTVTLWGEHWHSDQTVASTANGGITISGNGVTPYQVQWQNVLNNSDRDDMVTAGVLTGYQDVPGNSGGGTYDDWFSTAPLVIGNGTWNFFTGTNCCIDTMGAPVQITLTGITSVPPGTGPGDPGDPGDPSVVPLPAALPLMAAGLGLMGFVGTRRRRKS